MAKQHQLWLETLKDNVAKACHHNCASKNPEIVGSYAVFAIAETKE